MKKNLTILIFLIININLFSQIKPNAIVYVADTNTFKKIINNTNNYVQYYFDGYTHKIDTRTGLDYEKYYSLIKKSYSFEFSHNSKYLCVVSWDKNIKIYEASTAKLINSISSDTNVFLSAHFSPDDNSILTASLSSKAFIYDISSGKKTIEILGEYYKPKIYETDDFITNCIFSAKYSPDGKSIVTTSKDGIVRFYNSKTGEKIYSLRHVISDYILDNIELVDYSPDGTQILTLSGLLAKISDARTMEKIKEIEPEKLFTIKPSYYFSPDGKNIHLISDDYYIVTYSATDKENGQNLNTPKPHYPILNSLFSPNGQFIVAANYYQTILWDFQKRKIIKKFITKPRCIKSICFSNDNKYLALNKNDKTITIWDLEQKKDLIDLNIPFKVHDGNSFQFSPDNSHFAAKLADGSISIWETKTFYK